MLQRVSTSAIGALLFLALLQPACARPPRPPSSPTTLLRADAVTVAGWVRSPETTRRSGRIDARGAALGLQKLELGEPGPEPSVAEPGSCGDGLRSLLPIPDQPGVVLLSNADGQLLRYAEGELGPLTARTELPPIGELLGFVAQTSPLELLVRDLDGYELWMLEIGGTEVLSTTHVSGLLFGDRESFLQHYRVGRCTTGTRDCLSLVRDDEQLSLDRRHHPDAEPEIVMFLEQLWVADVAYADADGTSIYLLTSAVCIDDADPSRHGSGPVEP